MRRWRKALKCRPTGHQRREDLAVIISVTATEGLVELYLHIYNYLTTGLSSLVGVNGCH